MQNLAESGGIDSIQVLSAEGLYGDGRNTYRAPFGIKFRDHSEELRATARVVQTVGGWRLVDWDVLLAHIRNRGTPLTVGSTVAGEMDWPGDIDYFDVEIESPVMLTIARAGDADAYVRGRITGGPNATSGADDEADFRDLPIDVCTRPGLYALEVGGTPRTGSYNLCVSKNPRYDTPPTPAARATVGSTIAGQLQPPDYVDYLYIDIESPAMLVADLEPLNRFDARLTGPDCTSDNYFTLDSSVYNRMPVHLPGTYTLWFGEPHLWDEPPVPYRLRLWAEAAFDDHADTTLGATPVVFGTVITGRIEEPNDVDYFSFQVEQPVTLTLGPLDAEVSFALKLRGPGAIEERMRTKSSVELRLNRPGTYHLVVFGHNATGDYRLPVDAGATIEQDDHADSPELATPLAWGSTASGNLESSGDVDYFAIETAAPTVLILESALADSNEGANFRVRLTEHVNFRHMARQMWRLLTHQDTFRVPFPAPEDYHSEMFQESVRIEQRLLPGTYHLAVRGDPYDSTGTYNLQVSRGGPDDHADIGQEGTPIALGYSATGRLEWPGDIDYFQIHVPFPTTVLMAESEDTEHYSSVPVRARLTGPIGDPMALFSGRVLADAINKVRRTGSGGVQLVSKRPFRMERRLSRPGVYHLAVSQADTEDSTGSYAIRVSPGEAPR